MGFYNKDTVDMAFGEYDPAWTVKDNFPLYTADSSAGSDQVMSSADNGTDFTGDSAINVLEAITDTVNSDTQAGTMLAVTGGYLYDRKGFPQVERFGPAMNTCYRHGDGMTDLAVFQVTVVVDLNEDSALKDVAEQAHSDFDDAEAQKKRDRLAEIEAEAAKLKAELGE